MRMDPRQRFLSKVRKTSTCWLWAGHVMKNGYATFWFLRKPVLVHRFSYEMHVGPIPEGKQLDHKCHVTHCVNPDHLRPVTQKQNNENVAGPIGSNTSGARGVTWNKERKKWHVRVRHNRQCHSGGHFTDLREAEQAAIALRNKLFTHNIETGCTGEPIKQEQAA